MADPTSPNLSLPYPVGSDQVSGGPTDFENIVNILDAGANGPTVARTIRGTLSSFTSTYQSVPQNYPLGTHFICTDADVVFWQDGTPSWRSIMIAAHSQPIGSITQFAGSTVPADPDGIQRWVLCQGQAISRTTYATLFAAISTTYGSGDGSTTFNLPNLVGRFPLGKTSGGSLGTTGGSLGHTHSVPGLSVPGLSIPSLGTSGQSVPSLSVPAAGVTVFGHAHSLGAGFAMINPTSFSGTFTIEYTPKGSAPVDTTAIAFANGSSWGFSALTGSPTGVGLAGTTDSDGASGVTAATATGGGTTGGGSTTTGTTGTGTTGTGTSGAADPPYLMINHIIKCL